MSRPITLREAFIGLRNEGCDIVVAAVAALVWVVAGVEVTDER